jgi:pyridoxamine 5'-phosphate oxidase
MNVDKEKKLDLTAIRREYGALSLDEHDMHTCPIEQSKCWLAQALSAELDDPTAMVLSTVDVESKPDGRVVLLKEIQPSGYVFFTHFGSMKGQQIKANPFVALTLYWPRLVRQIRIRGKVSLLSEAESDLYFASRPYLSQLSAHVSKQSHPVSDRAVLELAIEQLKHHYVEGHVTRPSDWGGYVVAPDTVEFWQGRDNRLHDRILYSRHDGQWQKMRLAP